MLFLVALCFAILAVTFYAQLRKERLAMQGATARIVSVEQELEESRAQVHLLQQQFAAAHMQYRDLERTASAYRDRLERLAKFEKLDTLVALDDELVKLRQMEKEYRAKINDHIHSANRRAQKIVAQANERAEQLGQDVANVAREYRRYEQATTAMRNIVEGYGNAYIVPAQSLLDELAELYGHTDAGRELKSARDLVKQMVTEGTAATCKYVEESRRTTAIAFVVDAFNGKVDSILSRSKRDNFGTLKQAILDAFSLVNLNGRAFRDARITDEYLNARLDELYWACALHELRMIQLEEQRRIREQIRDEQKAQKEFERAIKVATKEESTLKKALEIAQRQLTEVSEEQRATYEAKLADLEAKLLAAEERNRRALSMAQQTRSGHVYIISNVGSFGEGIYKIGMTRRLEPTDRIRELGDASVPFNFDIHAIVKSEDAPALETKLHKAFLLGRVNKVNHRREFFRAPIEEIKKRVDGLGIEAQWTMAAEARQYLETQAIEKMIAEDPQARESWLQSQYRLEAAELESILSGNVTEDDDVILN